MGCIGEGLEATLTALGDRLGVEDSALVAMCRSTAQALEAHPERATLVKEYRECLVLLLAARDGGGDDFERLVAELSAPVRDST